MLVSPPRRRSKSGGNANALEAPDVGREQARPALRLGQAAAAGRCADPHRSAHAPAQGEPLRHGRGGAVAPPSDGRERTERTVDGSWNDLSSPSMGMIGGRFGRNVPIARTFPDPLPQLLEPN